MQYTRVKPREPQEKLTGVYAYLDDLIRLREPDGSARPIAWCHVHEGGRSWYTAGGHSAENFAEPLFVEHVMGGIRWAMDG